MTWLLTAACQLRLQIYSLGTAEDRVAIMVDGHRDAMIVRNLLQHREIPRRVLLLSKRGAVDFPGRVVDACLEAQPRTALLQPIVGTSIHLEQHPRFRCSLSSPTVTALRPTLPGALDPSLFEDATHRRPRQLHPLVLGKQLR
jgi:hypothetical protein